MPQRTVKDYQEYANCQTGDCGFDNELDKNQILMHRSGNSLEHYVTALGTPNLRMYYLLS